MKLEGLKAKSVNPVLLECTVCGGEMTIKPMKSLRTFTAWLNKFKRKHRCCSARIAARAGRNMLVNRRKLH